MDNNQFEKLVLNQQNTLYRISMSLLKNEADAQDAVHDSILKAYEKINMLKNDEAFSAWLIRILIHNCYKKLKQSNRFSDIGDTLPDVSSRDNPYISIEIGEAINSLPPKIRTVIILYYSEDYSVKEIKSILQIPEGTIKSRLSTGRALLKKHLKDYT